MQPSTFRQLGLSDTPGFRQCYEEFQRQMVKTEQQRLREHRELSGELYKERLAQRELRQTFDLLHKAQAAAQDELAAERQSHEVTREKLRIAEERSLQAKHQADVVQAAQQTHSDELVRERQAHEVTRQQLGRSDARGRYVGISCPAPSIVRKKCHALLAGARLATALSCDE